MSAYQRRLDFVRECNAIEGICREPHSWEVTIFDELLKLRDITIPDLKYFVGVIQPGARIRTERGMNVRVGSHFPPEGGPRIHKALQGLLADVHTGDVTPWEAHQRYEHLHPFMDGNGRSGRALWAWHMIREGQDPFALPFLHRFYYQSLDGWEPHPNTENPHG